MSFFLAFDQHVSCLISDLNEAHHVAVLLNLALPGRRSSCRYI